MPKISKRGQKRQSSKPEMKYLRTYIYVRLSEKDGGHGRRDSIYIQKQICEDYAKKHPEMICPLSSRQVKYLKVSDKNTYISFWSVGIFMHTISLYIF